MNNLLFKVVTTVRCTSETTNWIRGIVIEETRNTLKVLTLRGSVKTIIKEQCWFYVDDGKCTYLIPGWKLRKYKKG